MKEKPQVYKSCLNCLNFQWDGDEAHCSDNGRTMPIPDTKDDPDYGYCCDYI